MDIFGNTYVNKERIKGFHASQNRAVTVEDYMALIYSIPGRFGSVKRCMVTQDKDSFRRNLNIHIVTEDKNSRLIKASTSLKENIKTWLGTHKMVNDTVDILDAKICNIGISYGIMAETEANRYDILAFSVIVKSCFVCKIRFLKNLINFCIFLLGSFFKESSIRMDIKYRKS